MFTKSARKATPALVVTGLAFLGACGGGGDDVDVDEMEDEIATQLAEDANQPTPEVDCPDDLEPSQGEQFECTGTAQNGEQFVIEVTWSDDGGWDAEVPADQFE